jgi:hypothetical protein
MNRSFTDKKLEEFEKQFTYGVLYSASSDLTGGAGTHFKMDNARPAMTWLAQAITEAQRETAREIWSRLEHERVAEPNERGVGMNIMLDRVRTIIFAKYLQPEEPKTSEEPYTHQDGDYSKLCDMTWCRCQD